MFFKKEDMKFKDWIDSVFETGDFSNIKSINFNIYEGDGTFHLQVIGSSKTPEEDEEWYCDDDFTTGENVFIISREITGKEWEEGLEYFKKIVIEYIDKGKWSNILKGMKAVGIGFVDGDDEIIYTS